MAGWSGTFSNEEFTGPGIYQAKNGVRCFVDMDTVPGNVEVKAPLSPEQDNSYIISWQNAPRNVIEFTCTAAPFEDPSDRLRVLRPSLPIPLRRGLLGLTFSIDHWEVFIWNQFALHLSAYFHVGWRGRNTNGLCTLLPGVIRVVEVERTAQGSYTVRVDPGSITPGETIINPQPVATGLPASNNPVMFVDDVGMASPNEILVMTGLRNHGGVFMTDDLIQDANNFMSIVGNQFP